MGIFERISVLLTDPDYGMSDQYDSPDLRSAFLIVSLYAIITSTKSLIEGAIISGNFGMGLLTFLMSFLLVYVTWVLLSFFFHLMADVMGGLGELPNAFAFVGLAAAPMALTASISIIVSIFGRIILDEDPDAIVSKINVFITWLGMAWGWPGVLCYFGLKHAERLGSMKALILTLIAFFGMALFEIINLGIFSEPA